MFYMQECRDIIVSLNTEILEKPWKSIKVTPFHGRFCEGLLSENDFEAVLANFCCYD